MKVPLAYKRTHMKYDPLIQTLRSKAALHSLKAMSLPHGAEKLKDAARAQFAEGMADALEALQKSQHYDDAYHFENFVEGTSNLEFRTVAAMLFATRGETN
jgi:chromosomal replication initiation ATPase DnaA